MPVSSIDAWGEVVKAARICWRAATFSASGPQSLAGLSYAKHCGFRVPCVPHGQSDALASSDGQASEGLAGRPAGWPCLFVCLSASGALLDGGVDRGVLAFLLRRCWRSIVCRERPWAFAAVVTLWPRQIIQRFSSGDYGARHEKGSSSTETESFGVKGDVLTGKVPALFGQASH